MFLSINKQKKIMKAHYRKWNDGSKASSTYHKKDGTSVRAKFKNDLRKALKDN
jgi:hypothetical protein